MQDDKKRYPLKGYLLRNNTGKFYSWELFHACDIQSYSFSPYFSIAAIFVRIPRSFAMSNFFCLS